MFSKKLIREKIDSGDKYLSNRLHKLKKIFIRICFYYVLITLAYVFLYPFIYMIITSIKTYDDLIDPTVMWIPRSIHLENFYIGFKSLDFFKALFNTLLVVLVSTFGHVISCSFIGYGFARYQFKGKSLLFFFVILAMIVPIQTIIIPIFIQYANMGILDTFIPIIVPVFTGFGLRGPLFIFVFRQFYLKLPKDLEQAALVDGCNFFRKYWQIIFPIAKPAIVVTSVLSVLWHWHDHYEMTMFIRTDKLATLSLKLNSVITVLQKFIGAILSEGDVNTSQQVVPDGLLSILDVTSMNEAVLMASTILVILPLAIIFGFMQKSFTTGIERTGLIE